ncbi:MAG: hypothetical protein H6704_07740 [Myxococcales bacterium]|nr:hypothetical protein [Myxococcales bacterium]
MRAPALIVALAASLLACGGARFERPECQKAYDDCLDACETQCQPVGLAKSPVDENTGPQPLEGGVVGVDARCGDCVAGCRRRAEACDTRLPEDPTDPTPELEPDPDPDLP